MKDPARTVYISDTDGTHNDGMEKLDCAEPYYRELIGQANWVKAIREGKPGIKNERVAWDDIIE